MRCFPIYDGRRVGHQKKFIDTAVFLFLLVGNVPAVGIEFDSIADDLALCEQFIDGMATSHGGEGANILSKVTFESIARSLKSFPLASSTGSWYPGAELKAAADESGAASDSVWGVKYKITSVPQKEFASVDGRYHINDLIKKAYSHPSHKTNHIPIILHRRRNEKAFLVSLGNPEDGNGNVQTNMPFQLRNIGGLFNSWADSNRTKLADGQKPLLTKKGKIAFAYALMAIIRSAGETVGCPITLSSHGGSIDRIHVWIECGEHLQTDDANQKLLRKTGHIVRNVISKVKSSAQRDALGFGFDGLGVADVDSLEGRISSFDGAAVHGMIVGEVEISQAQWLPTSL